MIFFYTYDWIFLDQDYSHIKEIKEKFYMKNRAKLIGYISVGEIQKHRKYFNDLKKFAIGRNITWDSFIADLRSKEYRDFLVNIVAKDIVNKGFDGFFPGYLRFLSISGVSERMERFSRSRD